MGASGSDWPPDLGHYPGLQNELQALLPGQQLEEPGQTRQEHRQGVSSERTRSMHGDDADSDSTVILDEDEEMDSGSDDSGSYRARRKSSSSRKRRKRPEWTRSEEETLALLHCELGNQWATIAAQLPGRTANEVKNIWHSTLRSKSLKVRTLLRAYVRGVEGHCDDAGLRRLAYDNALKQNAASDAADSASAEPPQPPPQQQQQQRARAASRAASSAVAVKTEPGTGKRQRQPQGSPSDEEAQRSARGGGVHATAASTPTPHSASPRSAAHARGGAAAGGRRPPARRPGALAQLAAQHNRNRNHPLAHDQYAGLQPGELLLPLQQLPGLNEFDLNQQLAAAELEARRLSSPPDPSPSGASARPVAASMGAWGQQADLLDGKAAAAGCEMGEGSAPSFQRQHQVLVFRGTLSAGPQQEPTPLQDSAAAASLCQPAALSVSKQLPQGHLPGAGLIRTRSGTGAGTGTGAGAGAGDDGGSWQRSPLAPPPGTATSAAAAAATAAESARLLNPSEMETWLGCSDPSIMLSEADVDCGGPLALTAPGEVGGGGGDDGRGGREGKGGSGGGSGGGRASTGAGGGGGVGGGGSHAAFSNTSSSFAARGASVSQLLSETGPIPPGAASGAWSTSTAQIQLSHMQQQQLAQPTQMAHGSFPASARGQPRAGSRDLPPAYAASSLYGPAGASPLDSGPEPGPAPGLGSGPFARRSPLGYAPGPGSMGQPAPSSYSLPLEGGAGVGVFVHRYPGAGPVQVQRMPSVSGFPPGPGAGLAAVDSPTGDGSPTAAAAAAGLPRMQPPPLYHVPSHFHHQHQQLQRHQHQQQQAMLLRRPPQQRFPQEPDPPLVLGGLGTHPPPPPLWRHSPPPHTQAQQQQPYSARHSGSVWVGGAQRPQAPAATGGGPGRDSPHTHPAPNPGEGPLANAIAGLGQDSGLSRGLAALRASATPLTDVATMGLGAVLEDPVLSACLMGSGGDAGGGGRRSEGAGQAGHGRGGSGGGAGGLGSA